MLEYQLVSTLLHSALFYSSSCFCLAYSRYSIGNKKLTQGQRSRRARELGPHFLLLLQKNCIFAIQINPVKPLSSPNLSAFLHHMSSFKTVTYIDIINHESFLTLIISEANHVSKYQCANCSPHIHIHTHAHTTHTHTYVYLM